MSTTDVPATDAVVSVRNLQRRYRHKVALDGVDLTVRRGSVFGLVGENGAGKTTLVKHLLGTLRAKTGDVKVFGYDPARHPVDVLSRVGYLSEDRDLPGWMKVREAMHYVQSFYPSWDPTYAEELRVRFGLHAEARIKHLSRGEKAKTGLLLALAYRPDLVLLDEPSSGLDPAARRHILEAIVRTVAEEGRTVIFSSHLLDEVERVADEVAMIHLGKVVFHGRLDDIKERHRRFVVHFDEAQRAFPHLPGVLYSEGSNREWAVVCDGAADQLRAEIPKHGARIVEETVPSLEDIFLARVMPTDGE